MSKITAILITLRVMCLFSILLSMLTNDLYSTMRKVSFQRMVLQQMLFSCSFSKQNKFQVMDIS